jgi:UDP-N-acetylglucosamine 1-carboxyvinyltransferase
MPIRPASCTYRFEKSTHCGTENLILASVFNKGNVILENCAQEPEVNNMIETLNAMGAKIKRIQERTIEVKGVKPPLGSCEATSIYDRLEMGTAIILAVLNNGNITIENCDEKLLTVLVDTLQKIGVTLRFHGNKAEVANIELPLKPAEIETDWHPGFMTDWQPLMTMLLGVMSQGRSSIHEKIFEDRFHYLRELNKMGVRYRRYRPRRYVAQDYNFNDSEYREQDLHAAYVWGPTTLKPARMISTDVRAGINELIAAVIARGESEIDDPSGHIDRGYESIVEKFTNLGADILRI